MAIETFWVDRQYTTIQMVFSGQWQWDELKQARTEAATMLDEVDYAVNIIVYSEQETWMPPNYIQNVREVVSQVHPNAGLVVIVSTNPLFRTMFEMFNQIATVVSFQYRFVKSLEGAYKLLDISPDL
ncbi:MAG: hypothetical protein CL610_23705 [Anaerolineaceae bacterium]|nr:hypothetical protein [Anaerolineaceae bacterium]